MLKSLIVFPVRISNLGPIGRLTSSSHGCPPHCSVRASAHDGYDRHEHGEENQL